jgi:hypothetical protein
VAALASFRDDCSCSLLGSCSKPELNE